MVGKAEAAPSEAPVAGLIKPDGTVDLEVLDRLGNDLARWPKPVLELRYRDVDVKANAARERADALARENTLLLQKMDLMNADKVCRVRRARSVLTRVRGRGTLWSTCRARSRRRRRRLRAC